MLRRGALCLPGSSVGIQYQTHKRQRMAIKMKASAEENRTYTIVENAEPYTVIGRG